MENITKNPINIYVHAGSRGNPGPSAVGVVLTDLDNIEIGAWAESIPHSTNNVAEYIAISKGLQLANKFTQDAVQCHSDILIIINQLNGVYNTRNVHHRKHAEDIRLLSKSFHSVAFRYAPRNHPRIDQAALLVKQILDETMAAKP